MVENTNFQMAIDLLCCHLGMTEEQAKKQLGIIEEPPLKRPVVDTQQTRTILNSDK